jgi:methylglyoxal synthase
MNIALVAHDARKQEMIEWVKYNINVLKEHNIYATGTTGKLIMNAFYETELPEIHCWDEESFEKGIKEYYKDKITCLLSGPLGGDSQIGAMIAEGKIDMLIFFCDNLITQGHQQDVGALSRLASLYNIAFATNRTTADMIVTSPLINDEEYERIVPTAIDSYKSRQL